MSIVAFLFLIFARRFLRNRRKKQTNIYSIFHIEFHHHRFSIDFLVQITNEKFSKRPLENDERQQIIATIQDDNQGYYTKYNQLAYKLGDRTREFIYNQWLHIDPSCKRGRWSEDEQAQLLRRIDQQTRKITNWPLVSAPVQTRSSRQCRERALDTLKNGHRKSKEKHRLFTSEEDRLLIDQYDLHGPKWSLIAKEFSSRTDNSLLVRYRMLIKAKNQWTWYRQINDRMKNFLRFLYGKRTDDEMNDSEIQQDLQDFGFYRRGLPFSITDDEFEWFKKKPEIIERIGQIVLDEFQEKKLCARKFKVKSFRFCRLFFFCTWIFFYFRPKSNLGSSQQHR